MWEHYTQVRELNCGGMGSVWLVVDKRTRLPYVAKFMLPGLLRDKDEVRFRREVKALMSLDHPNIAKVYEATARGEEPIGYVMEYCPDGDVGTLKDPDVWHIVKALIAAVEELHSHGFVHRDIKPGNILLSFDGTPRLADFGLVMTTQPGRTVVTTSNWVSQGFAPPEQYVNMASVDRRADIYAIGAVWFYLLKRVTFDFDSAADQQLASISTPARTAIARCLAYSPDDRYSDTIDLLNAALQRNTADLESEDKDLLRKYATLDTKAREAMLAELYDVDEWFPEGPQKGLFQFMRYFALLVELLHVERHRGIRGRLMESYEEMLPIYAKIE